MQLWSESTRYFFDNPVNPNFGLRTPGSGRWSGSSPKFNHLVPGPCSTPPRNFVKIQRGSFFRIRIVIRNGLPALPDPDSDADRHQNVTICSLGQTQAVHKISSKSVDNLFDNQVNADFGLQTPGSRRWSGSSPKCIPPLSLGHALPLQEISSKSVHNFFSYPTDRQTDKQTEVKT